MSLNIKNKTVLVLVDFFVPISEIAPTLEALAKGKNRVTVVADFGSQTLELHAAILAEALKYKFIKLEKHIARLPEYDIPHMYFAADASLAGQIKPGDIFVTENLNMISRYEIARLTQGVDIFVNDAFSASESLSKQLANNIPKQQGPAFEKAKHKLHLFLTRSKKPLVLVLGGIRLANKLKQLDILIERADYVLVGGGAANLFLKAMGYKIGKSKIDEDVEEKNIKKLLRDYRQKIKLPTDLIVTSNGSSMESVIATSVKNHQKIIDIGPKTTLEFSKFIKQGKTLVWCGALGVVEEKKSSHGTNALLRLFASRSAKGNVVVAASGQAILPFLEQREFWPQLDLALTSSAKLLAVLTENK